jgi:hypothetical protein
VGCGWEQSSKEKPKRRKIIFTLTASTLAGDTRLPVPPDRQRRRNAAELAASTRRNDVISSPAKIITGVMLGGVSLVVVLMLPICLSVAMFEWSRQSVSDSASRKSGTGGEP